MCGIYGIVSAGPLRHPEVVDRMGADSFTPDSGVMLSKTKNADATPFVWVVDSHPENINTVDFVRPDGTKQFMTVGDYRQLSDALFHAGTGSGTKFEYEDTANRLHFYIIDMTRDAKGVLSYKLAVRSLDGAGPHTRGVTVSQGTPVGRIPAEAATCQFPLRNTGLVQSDGGKSIDPGGAGEPRGDSDHTCSADSRREDSVVVADRRFHARRGNVGGR